MRPALCPNPRPRDVPDAPARRRWLVGLAAMASVAWAEPVVPPGPSAGPRLRNTGRLLIIGGAEDAARDRVILRRFIELSGGPMARLRLLAAASSVPEAVAAGYRQAFEALGAQDVDVVPLHSPEHAAHPEVVQALLQADGLYMTGGDQSRLMGCLWETPAADAIHRLFHERGGCVAGTSAGAAVMSRAMLAQGAAVPVPEKDSVSLDVGLGLVPQAVVDQHFSQRRRLPRLLSALAERPDLLGIGIDEDTALLVEPERAVEVIGRGAVTLVDASGMESNADRVGAEEALELLAVQLHLLPAGTRYRLPVATAPRLWWSRGAGEAVPRAGDEPVAPAKLLPVLRRLLQRGPLRLS